MATKPRKDDPPPGPGEWMVTFSDTMTLLMCFFVLLLTFSSFEDAEKQKLAGVFQQAGHNTIFPVPREIKDSYLPATERPLAMTERGSGTPTDMEWQEVKHPRILPVVLDADAYKDRKIIRLPSSRTFWGRTAALTPAGRRCLLAVAEFAHSVPCRVILGEQGSEGGDGRLDRAWAAMELLAAQGNLSRERLSLTAGTTPQAAPPDGERSLVVILAGERLY